ncbi:MAG: hypothetical protein JJ901_12075 [Erythrobacter sp.]|jgi:hypothetical protein|uniref:Uncharacterized protein n=1 Tax=Sphingopyxis macrogoltabida TaxID=33050 RepID=A0A0N7GSP1_SPHMC|nr:MULTISPECIES: hypothetical protein [Sphingomonadales]ALH81259.1 hypothetical protein AN936_13060 [Sphingopyxis macrogoltabida]AMU90192.1 hypothetical protein ATM17_14250 [Sphingopyxis macrogoltabida]MBK6413960.1 hypothetical protein [Sphingopyxis sp.]MBO6769021.1 hypothetical protein [Erythrobacter sp.]MCK0099604.1 hypothetical protein [Qipengyuania sp. S6317L1]|tara:strand:+ start:39761 stop:40165 length:405 start_codon:yes stop_codon:yes gene_type:complete
MTLETTTLVDRVPLPTPMTARPDRQPIDWLELFQGTCLVLIETTGFAVTTLLLVLGLPLFVFLAVAGWDLGLLFAQLGNLADHYHTAEPIARRFFAQDLQIAFLIAAGGLALLRMPAFLRRLDRRLNEGDPAHV